MKFFSLKLNRSETLSKIFLCSSLCCGALFVYSCYSFRGGSVPDHIRTISIASAVDVSGFGDPTFREFCMETMVARFRSDNTLQLVDADGDARLAPSIIRVQDEMLNVAGRDLERERRISVSLEVEYFDAVKNRVVWKKTFSNFDVYEVATASTDRERAARIALRRIVDDVLLAVVSEW